MQNSASKRNKAASKAWVISAYRGFVKTIEERFWSKVDKTPGYGPDGDCWFWAGAKNDGGYGKITANGRRAYRAHRLSYELVHGPIPEGQCVLHRCDIRACVRPEHLFLGTVADNNKDTAHKGRIRGGQGKGSAHPKAVINERIVEMIWSLQQQGLNPTSIAQTLKLNRSTVKNIVYGGYWSHTKAA